MCGVTACAVYRLRWLIVHLDAYPVARAQVCALTQVLDSCYCSRAGIHSARERVDRAKEQRLRVLGSSRQQDDAAAAAGAR